MRTGGIGCSFSVRGVTILSPVEGDRDRDFGICIVATVRFDILIVVLDGKAVAERPRADEYRGACVDMFVLAAARKGEGKFGRTRGTADLFSLNSSLRCLPTGASENIVARPSDVQS